MTATLLDRAEEAVALRLMQAVRADAEAAAAPHAVSLVSVTLDLSGNPGDPAALDYAARIDRKTRTILFTGGRAQSASGVIMTATAVYRIVHAEAK